MARRKNPSIPGFGTKREQRNTLLAAGILGSLYYTVKCRPDLTRAWMVLAGVPLAAVGEDVIIHSSGDRPMLPPALLKAAPYMVGAYSAYLAYSILSRPGAAPLSGLPVQQGLLIGPHTPSL
jgi:hypothetical protein